MSEIYKAPSPQEISDLLTGKFAGKVEITGTEDRRVFAKVDRDSIYEVCEYIHDNLTFEHISTVIGVDMKDKMQVVYHISNYFNGVVIELTADVPNDDLRIASVTPIWQGCNWHERETYELFGIVFEGHPKLERLLTPDDYEFFPFRKSYKLRGWE